jgi:hypothetical protein
VDPGQPGNQDAAEKGDRFGWALAFGDFDDDGYDDLAIGIKGEDLEGAPGAGAVAVLYGSASGLTSDRDQFFTQDTPELRGVAEEGDSFGYALASAQFGSTCGHAFGDDLAIGVRNEDLGASKVNAGAVNVIYNTKDGLDACGSQLWSQDTGEGFGAIQGVAEEDDRFGSSLAAGSFDAFGDGLVIGVPGEDLKGAVDAGGINELRQYTGLLVGLYNQFWSQNKGDMADEAEAGDLFASALASTNFMQHDFDFYQDLVVGVPGEDGGEGAVHVLWSDDSGVGDHGYFFTQTGSEEAGARFGEAVAAGTVELSQGNVPILAIGAPGDDVDAMVDAGSVTVRYWSEGVPGDPTVWTQDTADVEDSAESEDEFGSSLLLAVTSGTYSAMLAIGVPLEDVDSIADAGAVNVIYGASAEFVATDDQIWTQDSEGVEGSAEPEDAFGSSLA